MKRFARIAAIAGKGVLVALLALLLAYDGYILIARACGVRAPTVFGFATAAVATGSMAPAIDAGDLIVTRAQDGYEVGDVVTYLAADGTSTTHRIIAKSGENVHDEGRRQHRARPRRGGERHRRQGGLHPARPRRCRHLFAEPRGALRRGGGGHRAVAAHRPFERPRKAEKIEAVGGRAARRLFRREKIPRLRQAGAEFAPHRGGSEERT